MSVIVVVFGSVGELMVGDATSVLEINSQPVPRSAQPDPAAGVTIAEAPHRTGFSVHTLRYCERAGLIVTTVDHTAGGRRRYHQLDLDWITVCTKLRSTGMPIKAIRRYAQLVSAGHGNEHERLAQLEAHRADVIAKLAQVQDNLKTIERKIDVYRGRLAAGEADQLWAPHRPAGAR